MTFNVWSYWSFLYNKNLRCKHFLRVYFEIPMMRWHINILWNQLDTVRQIDISAVDSVSDGKRMLCSHNSSPTEQMSSIHVFHQKIQEKYKIVRTLITFHFSGRPGTNSYQQPKQIFHSDFGGKWWEVGRNTCLNVYFSSTLTVLLRRKIFNLSKQ